jgi:hypothetical protein
MGCSFYFLQVTQLSVPVEQGGDFKNPRGLISPFYRGVDVFADPLFEQKILNCVSPISIK